MQAEHLKYGGLHEESQHKEPSVVTKLRTIVATQPEEQEENESAAEEAAAAEAAAAAEQAAAEEAAAEEEAALEVARQKAAKKAASSAPAEASGDKGFSKIKKKVDEPLKDRS